MDDGRRNRSDEVRALARYAVSALQAGGSIGPYEIVRPIGSGGMGEVFRARDTKLGREVAIKVLPAVFAQDVEG